MKTQGKMSSGKKQGKKGEEGREGNKRRRKAVCNDFNSVLSLEIFYSKPMTYY